MASFLSKAFKEVTSTISPSSQSIAPSTISRGSNGSGALTLFATTAIMATIMQKYSFSSCIGGIYDKIIVSMTEVWYRKVLEKQKRGAVILDVGIGTAGALLKCKDIVKEKNLTVIGIDYNTFYVNAAQTCIEEQEMTGSISVHAMSIYDDKELEKVLAGKKVDSVYFSGSFSLLPDPKGALASVEKVLKPKGEIYITQTYQKKYSPVMSRVKPMIKFVTTIDFGQLVTVTEIAELFNNVDGMEVKEHSVMEGSIDNRWQAAYLSILVRNGNGGGKVKVAQQKKGLWNWF